MPRRRRRSPAKAAPVANPNRTTLPAALTAPRETDAPGENPAYSEAVSCVLGALEGLWYESDYSHKDYKDKVQWEQEVNGFVQSMKQNIQAML